MPLVRFGETCVTREADPQRFEAGAVYDLPPASADRWLIRGKADRVADDDPAGEPAGGAGAPTGDDPGPGAGAGAPTDPPARKPRGR